MRGFIATYRWELWLLLWAPLVSWLASSTALMLAGFLSDQGLLDSFFYSYSYVGGAAGTMVQAGLLLLLYPWVRRLERGFLTLVWRYELVLAAIAALLSVFGLALSLAFDEAGPSRFVFLATGLILAGFIATLPPLLWFARRASRTSLAHAFFLFLVMASYGWTGLLVPLAVDLVPRVQLVLVLSLISLPLRFLTGFLLAWLLGNFESRSDAFRKRVVGALLAIYVVSNLGDVVEIVVSTFGRDEGILGTLASVALELFLSLVFLILPLALIYLVRVRAPALADAPPLLPSEDR